MHLWQIRHIPNHPQTLLKLTLIVSVIGAGVATLFPSVRYAFAQAADTAKVKAGDAEKTSEASDFLAKVRQELPKHQSIQAELLQTVSIGDQQFRVSGQYVSAGQKLRLNYKVMPDQGAQGEMLEVCDGKELWTQLTMPESKRVTQRNVQQIMAAAAAANKKQLAEQPVGVELGLGGLVALLASLDRSMIFDGIKTDPKSETPRTIIQGHWKKDIAPRDKDQALPPYVPDLVHVFINNQTLFPEKILYLKKQPGKKTFKALVSLEFRNPIFDEPVDDETFVFQVPDGEVPEDVTKQYIDRLLPPKATPPAAN